MQMPNAFCLIACRVPGNLNGAKLYYLSRNNHAGRAQSGKGRVSRLARMDDARSPVGGDHAIYGASDK